MSATTTIISDPTHNTPPASGEDTETPRTVDICKSIALPHDTSLLISATPQINITSAIPMGKISDRHRRIVLPPRSDYPISRLFYTNGQPAQDVYFALIYRLTGAHRVRIYCSR
jgi:hypothetical protein